MMQRDTNFNAADSPRAQPDAPATRGLKIPTLVGANPMAFFAALGMLEAFHHDFEQGPRRSPERCAPTLRWDTEALRPVPVFDGAGDIAETVALVLNDRDFWMRSTVLTGAGVFPSPPNDLKVDPPLVRRWYEHTLRVGTPREARLFRGLLSEGALDASKGTAAKPTHLHFTAGNQAFLKMVRELGAGLDEPELVEALVGPWSYTSVRPSLGWDNTLPDRQYALRAGNPAAEKRPSIPGAEWLAFLGLAAFVVQTRSPAVALTTACDPGWKGGAFTWSLWDRPLGWMAVRSLLSTLATADSPRRFPIAGRGAVARAIGPVFTATIHRADQGGYGSFGATALVT